MTGSHSRLGILQWPGVTYTTGVSSAYIWQRAYIGREWRLIRPEPLYSRYKALFKLKIVQVKSRASSLKKCLHAHGARSTYLDQTCMRAIAMRSKSNLWFFVVVFYHNSNWACRWLQFAVNQWLQHPIQSYTLSLSTCTAGGKEYKQARANTKDKLFWMVCHATLVSSREL